MKILRNLFNKSDTKIDVNEIAITNNGVAKLLGNAVIVESGSNQNGSYVKFGDGTQMCTGVVAVDISIWNFNAGRKTLPKPFVGDYSIGYSRISPSVESSAQQLALGSLVPSASSSTEIAFGVGSPIAGTKVFNIAYTAIGRWK